MMCILSLYSYGRPVVVRCMGVRLGMGRVGSMEIDPRTTLLSHAEYVPMLTAAAALRVKAALTKATW